MEKEMVFYLKVNRNNSYVIPNLKHWLEAAQLHQPAYIYILCDNRKLRETIIHTLDVKKDNIEFLTSFRTLEEMNDILENVTEGKWMGVGQAHFTTFWHAKQNNIKYFWNIDADDTYMCLSPARLDELLKKVENYTVENRVSMMSLDIWRSISVSEKWETEVHWSLGVTYVDNTFDWIGYMQSHCTDIQYEEMKKHYKNIDWFFTYLREYTGLKIETFYFENLKFLHFFDYFINNPHGSRLYHWKNEKIIFPILKYCFGAKCSSEAQIAEDVVKFDFGIKDVEALKALISCSGEESQFYRDIQEEKSNLAELMKERNRLYLEKLQCKELIGWGAGNAFLRNYPMIKEIHCLKYICDINSFKWDKVIVDDVKCISPDELKKMDDVAVIIMVDDIKMCFDIVRNLLDMGITNFDHVSRWLKYVQAQ